MHLPEWLPQSHLCLDANPKLNKKSYDPKKGAALKHEKVNELRVFYEIVAKADQLFDGGHFAVLNLETSRRITVLTPEFSPPIYEQQMKVNNKIKSMGIFNHGKCTLTSVLYKDVLYPKE